MERTYPPSNRWIRLKAVIKSTLETDSFPATATSHVRSENIDYVLITRILRLIISHQNTMRNGDMDNRLSGMARKAEVLIVTT